LRIDDRKLNEWIQTPEPSHVDSLLCVEAFDDLDKLVSLSFTNHDDTFEQSSKTDEEKNHEQKHRQSVAGEILQKAQC
jgi:hypothetical protein